MGAVVLDELVESLTGRLVLRLHRTAFLALIVQTVDGQIGGIGHVVADDGVEVGLNIGLLHGHVNKSQCVFILVLLEGAHVEAGRHLALESAVFAAELGLGLQVVGQLAVAAARVVALLKLQLDGILREQSVLRHRVHHADGVAGYLVGHGVEAVAYAVDAPAF